MIRPKARDNAERGMHHRAYHPYMYSVICLGFALVILALYQAAAWHIGYKWLILASLTVLSSSYAVRIPGTNSKISIGDTFFFTNVILYGTPAGVITAAVDALVGSLRARSRSRRVQFAMFNMAAIAISAYAGGTAFFAVIGRGPLSQAPQPTVSEMLVPLAALAFAHYFCNSGSVAVIVALERRKNVWLIWKESFLWTSITYFAGAAAAGFVAFAIGSITPQVVGVAVPVLLAIYFTYKTYLDKVQEVRSLAYYDTLTMLPNRMLFKERLNEALGLGQRLNQMVAVMFLDLDNFKRINDTYGHNVGDQLLRCVAARIASTLRLNERDCAGETRCPEIVVGRFGGDEFTLLMSDIDGPERAAQVAQRLLDAFSNPFGLDQQEVSVAASIGISLFPVDGTNTDTLLKNADAAMFHAKDSGRSNYYFYSKAMNEASSEKLALENDLRKALSRGEFQLYYQPKVDARTRQITGAEALIRWRHPVRGLVPAAEFIALSEQTGLITPIGEWVLRTACNQVSTWLKAGLPAVPVAVNLSGIQFRKQNLHELISGVLTATPLDPSYLELEITESMIMQNEGEADSALRQLRSLGLKISIDDFGTGYSSLSRLKSFTLDALKVDRSFVKDLARNPDDKAITRAIIAMARSLDLRVIAEGVETEQQMQFLVAEGCHELQGYLVGRPMPAEEFIAHACANPAGRRSPGPYLRLVANNRMELEQDGAAEPQASLTVNV